MYCRINSMARNMTIMEPMENVRLSGSFLSVFHLFFVCHSLHSARSRGLSFIGWILAGLTQDGSNALHPGAQLRDAPAQSLKLTLCLFHSIELAAHKARVGRDAFFHSRDAILGLVVELRGQHRQQFFAPGFHLFLEAFLGLLALVGDDEKADNRQDAGRQYAGDVKGR
jgi:hypothetical protein